MNFNVTTPWYDQPLKDFLLRDALSMRDFHGHVSDAIEALITREALVTLAEYKALRMNSFERTLVYTRLDDEALDHLVAHTIEQTTTIAIREVPTTYEETIVSVLLPLLRTRLRESARARAANTIPSVPDEYPDEYAVIVGQDVVWHGPSEEEALNACYTHPGDTMLLPPRNERLAPPRMRRSISSASAKDFVVVGLKADKDTISHEFQAAIERLGDDGQRETHEKEAQRINEAVERRSSDFVNVAKTTEALVSAESLAKLLKNTVQRWDGKGYKFINLPDRWVGFQRGYDTWSEGDPRHPLFPWWHRQHHGSWSTWIRNDGFRLTVDGDPSSKEAGWWRGPYETKAIQNLEAWLATPLSMRGLWVGHDLKGDSATVLAQIDLEHPAPMPGETPGQVWVSYDGLLAKLIIERDLRPETLEGQFKNLNSTYADALPIGQCLVTGPGSPWAGRGLS